MIKEIKKQDDLEISVGAGLPNNKAYRYTIIRQSFLDHAITTKEYREYLIKQLGLDVQEYPETIQEQQEIGLIDEENQRLLQSQQMNGNVEGLTPNGRPSLNYMRGAM